jgi:hypothetical protein
MTHKIRPNRKARRAHLRWEVRLPKMITQMFVMAKAMKQYKEYKDEASK